MSAFAMEQATVSTLATGGVCCPDSQVDGDDDSNWTGSIPTAWTSGITTGTTRMMRRPNAGTAQG